MKLSLSTNWCNRRMESGEEIVDKALELGFDELELGFHTSEFQARGFKARLSEMPVGSIHAFCPVPVSAPQGHPELYTLATLDADAREIAKFHIIKNIRFAAEIGADTVVHHAGRVQFSSFFHRNMDSGLLRMLRETSQEGVASERYIKTLAKAKSIRRKNGEKILGAFLKTLEEIVPELEKTGVTLALENLPYLEGFPDEFEMREVTKNFGDHGVKAWFDTGHHRVRECHNWIAKDDIPELCTIQGMHLNDVKDFDDDHFPPGFGNVDFDALAYMMRAVKHVVIEPNHSVDEDSLKQGIARIRKI